jgi:hypothetical protein
MKYVTIALTLCLVLFAGDLLAQCPMCRATAESNLANGGTEGQGLNRGILYLLAMPYLLSAVLGYIWWRNRRPDHEMA